MIRQTRQTRRRVGDYARYALTATVWSLLVGFVMAMAAIAIMALMFTVATGVRADEAPCASDAVAGSWKVYQTFLVDGTYQHCGLRVGRTGEVIPGTRCRDSAGVESYVTNGRLTVRPRCRVEGWVENWFGRFAIDHAFLSPSWNRVTGVGKAEGRSVKFEAVRRPR